MDVLQQMGSDKANDSKELVDCIKEFRIIFELSTNDLANAMIFNHKDLVDIESTCIIPPKYTYKLLGMVDELKKFATLDNDKKKSILNELYDKLKNFIVAYQ
ncbi:MAG: hypothetical protein Q8T08_21900 [Ignavibacteria bacterium]|nr:hypothetical protein [Ignavibacteria bacterium]